jgi:hypothetical protein
MLKPKSGFDSEFFAFESEMELLTPTPPKNIDDMLASFGPTDFLMKQSILPAVAWEEGASSIRCVGTAFIVSCTGYLVTASHVLLDPKDSGYGKLKASSGAMEVAEDWNMGVLLPISPASGVRGFQFIPFEQAWYWGQWEENPLFCETEKLNSLTDVAVAKIPQRNHGSAYQPLSLSFNPFSKGELAYVIGYAEMEDIPIEYTEGGQPVIREFKWDLYVSIGEVTDIFPNNHIDKEVPTPGPSFDFRARIPGKMSGAPIFGAKGTVIRGVISRSYSGEKHASGCMIGPVMSLPFTDGRSLRTLMDAGSEGIPVVQGVGL